MKGHNRKKNSHFTLTGPQLGIIAKKIRLKQPSSYTPFMYNSYAPSDAITLENGTIICIHKGILQSISQEGHINWYLQLEDEKQLPARLWTPLLSLQGNTFLFALKNEIRHYDSEGHILITIPLQESFCIDNYGSPLTLIYSADNAASKILISCPLGGLLIINVETMEIVTYPYGGYNVSAPALFSDESMAVSNLYQQGICRIDPQGTIIWHDPKIHADSPSIINQNDIAAFSSQLTNATYFYDKSGIQLYTYPQATRLGTDSLGNWIAVSEDSITKIAPDGKVVWKHALRKQNLWYRQSPFIDIDDCCYIFDGLELMGYNPQGKKFISLMVNSKKEPCIFPLENQIFGMLTDSLLLVIQ